MATDCPMRGTSGSGQAAAVRSHRGPKCGGSEVRTVLSAWSKCGLLNQIHTGSIGCRCPSVLKLANEGLHHHLVVHQRVDAPSSDALWRGVEQTNGTC